MKLNKKQKIYRDYIMRPAGVTDKDIANKHKVTRRYVHEVVSNIKKGGSTKKSTKERINRCMEDKRKQCMWECWFKDWYEALTEMKETRLHQPVIDDFVLLVRTMHKEGFSKTEIARLTKRNHATIDYHLNK